MPDSKVQGAPAADRRAPSPEEVAGLAREAAAEGCPFLFSVVVAVHNTEDYLDEAVQSVLAQTVGPSCIQIVLVNDGSTDGSLAVCRKHESRHPGNVVVVDQPNAGVSAARNAGLARARGRYVNFLDSDDRWSEDAFAWALAFFRDFPGVKLAASRYVMFGAKEGNHRLNYKFKTTRVIDLLVDHDCPQLSVSSCFFDRAALDGRAFDERLAVSEDALLINEILLDELRYGAMSEPVYLYRQRERTDSAIDRMHDSVAWHLDTPRLCGRRLVELSREKHGEVLPFVQYTVMYDLQWHLRAPRPRCLDDAQLAEYRALIVGLLDEVDDAIIASQRSITTGHVLLALCLKHGLDPQAALEGLCVDGGMVRTGPAAGGAGGARLDVRPLDSLSDKLEVEGVAEDGGAVVVWGHVDSFLLDVPGVEVAVRANNRPQACETYEDGRRLLPNPFVAVENAMVRFVCAVPMEAGEQVSIKADCALLGGERRRMRFSFPAGGRPAGTGPDGPFALEEHASSERPGEVLSIRKEAHPGGGCRYLLQTA